MNGGKQRQWRLKHCGKNDKNDLKNIEILEVSDAKS